MMFTVATVLKYLELPERPSREELNSQVKAFIGAMASKDKLALLAKESSRKDYAYDIEFLRQVGFTSLEASWYAGVGLDTPEIRKLVARRALALKRSNRPYTATAYDLQELEKEVLKDMTDEQVLEELKKDE